MILWEQSTGKTMLLCITIKIQLLRLLHWIWKGQRSIHPLTISSYNVGKTILDRSTYKGYNGQDVIISFSKNTGSNAAGSYYGGNLFKEQDANKVGFIFMQIWVHLQIHHLRVGKIPMEDGNIKTLTEVM